MEKEILSLFDSAGKCIANLIRGVNYSTDKEKSTWIKKGYVVISEDDWSYYIGNHGAGQNGTGYIRDPETGKPVSAPAYVPTRDEQATLLYNECQKDLKEIDAQIVNAIIIKDTELVEELRAEREDRIAQYQKDLDDLGGEE